jgi:predicted nucleotidyltransferase
MSQQQVRQQFTAALDALVTEIKKDRSILAVVLCGSLSHDTVWAKSDIDLVLVTIDEKQLKPRDLSLYADGVNVHALPFTRTELREVIEGSRHSSFLHSFLAKGRLLYTHDETIADLCARLQSIGGRDANIALLHAATAVLPALYKARKFFLTRADYAYTSLWLLYATSAIARMEIVGAGLLADREVIPQAATLNPALFKTIYTDLLEGGTRKQVVERALLAAEAYMAQRAPAAFGLVLEYFKETGDVRSARDAEDHFTKNFAVSCVTTACEYLADLGLLGKASTAVLLTKKSNTSVEELAFFATDAHG